MAPCRTHRNSFTFLCTLVLLGVSGCLPFSCQPRESNALYPSDSLSRRVAQASPVDTLTLAWVTQGEGGEQLEYPRTLRFGPEGRIFVSDIEKNQIFEFLPDGILQRTYSSLSYDTPYLAGIQNDTLLVFNPKAGRIDMTVGEESFVYMELPPESTDPDLLNYVAGTSNRIYYKVLGEGFDGYLATLDRNGEVIARTRLTEPFWRYAGMLRLWGSSVVSLSAYRPVVDVLHPEGRLDSLALRGFDSPMLPRSRAFAMGRINQPPMLTSSAAAAGASLFVLNLRPGWLRIDVFGRDGRLERRLVQANPGFERNFYPVDLDVRAPEAGRYEIAVAFYKPEPQIAMYTWNTR